MASVTSFTATKIQSLLAEYEGISLSQQEILSLLQQLFVDTESNDAQMTELREVILPQLQDDLAANSIELDTLADTTLPNLQADLAQASLQLENINTVDLPSMRQDLDAEITNNLDRPKTYVQPDEPTNPDEDNRDLVVGDSWFDDDDNNKQYVWNGAQWSTFSVDVADFTLTAQKFKTSTHMIY